MHACMHAYIHMYIYIYVYIIYIYIYIPWYMSKACETHGIHNMVLGSSQHLAGRGAFRAYEETIDPSSSLEGHGGHETNRRLTRRVSRRDFVRSSTFKLKGAFHRPRYLIPHPTKNICLVVGPPLWKKWKSIGMMTFPIYGKMPKMATKPATRYSCNWLMGYEYQKKYEWALTWIYLVDFDWLESHWNGGPGACPLDWPQLAVVFQAFGRVYVGCFVSCFFLWKFPKNGGTPSSLDGFFWQWTIRFYNDDWGYPYFRKPPGWIWFPQWWIPSIKNTWSCLVSSPFFGPQRLNSHLHKIREAPEGGFSTMIFLRWFYTPVNSVSWPADCWDDFNPKHQPSNQSRL